MPEELSDLYRQIFLYAPIGFAISDDTGKVVDANEAQLRLGGYAREDLIGKTAAYFYSGGPEERERVVAEMRKRGHLDRHELQFKKKDGSLFWAHMTLRPFMHDGRRFIIAMIEDITELKNARDERKRQETEMREVMKSLIGREHRMIELKDRIAELEGRLNEEAKQSEEEEG